MSNVKPERGTSSMKSKVAEGPQLCLGRNMPNPKPIVVKMFCLQTQTRHSRTLWAKFCKLDSGQHQTQSTRDVVQYQKSTASKANNFAEPKIEIRVN